MATVARQRRWRWFRFMHFESTKWKRKRIMELVCGTQRVPKAINSVAWLSLPLCEFHSDGRRCAGSYREIPYVCQHVEWCNHCWVFFFFFLFHFIVLMRLMWLLDIFSTCYYTWKFHSNPLPKFSKQKFMPHTPSLFANNIYKYTHSFVSILLRMLKFGQKWRKTRQIEFENFISWGKFYAPAKRY